MKYKVVPVGAKIGQRREDKRNRRVNDVQHGLNLGTKQLARQSRADASVSKMRPKK